MHAFVKRDTGTAYARRYQPDTRSKYTTPVTRRLGAIAHTIDWFAWRGESSSHQSITPQARFANFVCLTRSDTQCCLLYLDFNRFEWFEGADSQSAFASLSRLCSHTRTHARQQELECVLKTRDTLCLRKCSCTAELWSTELCYSNGLRTESHTTSMASTATRAGDSATAGCLA